jgi:hypothetical protein
MSSAGRSNHRDNHANDYYVTPEWIVKEFLEYFEKECLLFKIPNITILDPCAGGDVFNTMTYPMVLSEMYGFEYHNIITMDIREDSRASFKEDYLTNTGCGGLADIIITNPPFNLSEKIVEKALQDVKDGGYVIMLLRSSWLGTKKRNKFILDNIPAYCYYHSRRACFTANGKNDSTEYAHFVWQKGYKAEYTKMIVTEYNEAK